MLNKETNIYIDIDGTLIHEDLPNYNKPAAHLAEFLEALSHYNVYWLTTHCRHGDETNAQRHLQKILPPELFQYVLAYKPTTWGFSKTEGIDFLKPFVWFDNNVVQSELDELERNGASDSLVLVDLVKKPEHLSDILKKCLT